MTDTSVIPSAARDPLRTGEADSSRSRFGMTRAFRIERDGDLAIIWFDLPGEKVN